MTEEIEPWSCYLRPAPPGLSLQRHYTVDMVSDEIYQFNWYPTQCYYCPTYKPTSRDDWEDHVIRYHPSEKSYPGPSSLRVSQVLKAIDDRDTSRGFMFVEERIE